MTRLSPLAARLRLPLADSRETPDSRSLGSLREPRDDAAVSARRAPAALARGQPRHSLFQIRFEPEAARVGGAERIDPM
jgi:hypothetical protein